MFDIGFWEIAVIGAIMLVVLGPERLPGVARTAGFWLGKLRSMVSDVKAEVKREMDAAELKELDDVKDQINKAGKNMHEELNKEVLETKKIENVLKDHTPDTDSKANESNEKS